MSKASKPTTGALIKEAIVALKERGGSSLAAIKKYFASKNIEVQPHNLRAALKKLTSNGELVKVKGSWKIGAAASKPKKVKAAKSPAAKKPKATKAAKTTKKATKKAAPADAAPKAKKAAPKAKKASAKKTKVAKPKAAKKSVAKK